ncbi:unnamed protein product [Lymnaea stagnalis]|uniref:Uncharacterized protein n=1 Tax=Lymnaea stagnalis TaxID=6523 RepID=A0AAV2ID49_LYMST
MALMKTGNNTALCVFETLAGALKAIRNSVSMPGKCRVIVSWWYSQLTNFATFQRVKDDKNAVSRWLMTQVKEVLSVPGGVSRQSSLVDKKDQVPDRTSVQRFPVFPRLSYQLARSRSSDLETRDGSEDERFKDELADKKARYSVCPRASREVPRRTISVSSEPIRNVKPEHIGDLQVA